MARKTELDSQLQAEFAHIHAQIRRLNDRCDGLLGLLREKQPEPPPDPSRCGHPFDIERRDDGAGRYLAGLHVDCDLPPFHTGNHQSDHGVFSIHWML